MKAFYKGNQVDVWEIGKANEQPEWVKKAFAENYLVWLDNRLRILMSGLNPSLSKNMKLGAVGSVGGGFCGYIMYDTGYIGDYLDITNHRVVSKKRFNKEYQFQQMEV